MLLLIVNIWFQVLFHSPSGVLFTFPSRYYTLSVTRSYLALGDGPPIFTLDSTCPVLLWILTAHPLVSPTGLLPYIVRFSNQLRLHRTVRDVSPNPVSVTTYGLGSFPFAHHYLGNRFFFLFLLVLRCFNSQGSPPYTMYSCKDTTLLKVVRSRIRISTDHHLFAVPRGFSQLVTSFFGA